MDNLVQIVEAIIFSAGTEIKKKDILDKLPDVTRKELNDAIRGVAQRYKGDRGIILVEVNDKVQFSSNPKYGETVAEVLRPIKEKELSNTLLEVLAMIAYKQPITRAEIEEIRGVSADYAITMLTRANLIKVSGHRNTPGRPWLYVTTSEFLKKFQLRSLNELPEYKEVMRRLVEYGNFNAKREDLYKEVDLADDFQGDVFESGYKDDVISNAERELDEFMNTDELPEFLKDSDVEYVQGEVAASTDDDQELQEDIAAAGDVADDGDVDAGAGDEGESSEDDGDIE